MQRFDHLLTTRPHEIKAVFISDLHLSNNTPALSAAFVALLKDLSALPNLHSLYILGDWLDGWIGDDDYLTLTASDRQAHWLTPAILALQQLSDKTTIFVMHGNRDFAIRQGLCDEFGGKLIKEPHFLHTDITYRLEHGDRLCTDDKKYQRYRTIIQHPIITWLLLKQPLSRRRKISQAITAKSTKDKAQKAAVIMDVNHHAVTKAWHTCDVLIHGHTHRPAMHDADPKKRLVLGDWRSDDGKVFAVIGLMSDDVRLCQFTHH